MLLTLPPQQTSDELATLPVGTEVSAKYKGAFCEAKVKKVGRQVKCKVTFKLNLGTFTLCESSLTYSGPLVSGCQLEARHPEKGSVHEAVVNKIYDQSQYTVVFDDGDIATLKRNSLHMKSGKHFNASESLDNLPLTHPEHFGTPVGARRRARDEDDDDDDEEDSSEDEADQVPYISKLGSVVMVEVSDKKNTKTKENWFPGLVVSPHAQDQRKINTKEDFLIRSFRDQRYFTVPRKECKKFHKDSGKKVTEQSLLTAIELANAYLADNEKLPDHWDRENLFNMRDDSSTEGSSDDEEASQLSDDEEVQSPEEKDHLVAELYKHMDDRGTPINRTPCIGNQEVDLYTLFRLVQKLGGTQRVTNNNQWRSVAKRLGFETNWCVNQVRVCYKRYLQSFEELYKQLGCTLINHPKGNNMRVRHGSGRPLVRGVRVGSKAKEDEAGASDRSSISSQEGGEGPSSIKKEKVEIKEELLDEIDFDSAFQKIETEKKSKKIEKAIKDEPLDEETEVYDRTEKIKVEPKKKSKEEIRMTTRPRRDSTSSLNAAVELKAKKEDIGDSRKEPRDSKKKVDKSKDDDDSGSNSGSVKVGRIKKDSKRKMEEFIEEEFLDEECSSDLDAGVRKKNKTPFKGKPKGVKVGEENPIPTEEIVPILEGEELQHLKPNVECQVGDKIKVFWRHGQIYEAKIMKAGKDKKEGKFYVHYQGWNQRYDEWITRGKIAENLTWDENPRSHKAREQKAEKQKQKKNEKADKCKVDEEEEEEKQDTDDKNTSEEEKEEPEKKEEYRKKIMKKAKSVTPTSTPSSSRTSSPASMKRTKSPAPKKAMSPSVKDKTPMSPCVKDKTPMSPSVKDKTPISPSVKDKTPMSPSGRDKTPGSPNVKDKTPIPASVKEKTPIKEKKKEGVVPKRNVSPSPSKSPLKRQSSRTSVYKPSDDNEDNEEGEVEEKDEKEFEKEELEKKEDKKEIEVSEDTEEKKENEEKEEKEGKEAKEDTEAKEDIEEKEEKEGEKTPRRSNRGEREKGELEKKVKTVPRSSSNTRAGEKREKVEAETDEDQEGKKISESIISQPSVRLGKMRSLTPIKKNGNAKSTESSSDPYVFQEPDESPSKFETPTKNIVEKVEDERRSSPRDCKSIKKEELVKVELPSSEENNVAAPGEVFKVLTAVATSPSRDGKVQDKEVKGAREEEDKEKKPFLQMTDQYASLFPHLASLRAQSTDSASPIGSPGTSGETPSTPVINIISSASFINEIVESSIIKSQSDPEEKKEITKEDTSANEKEEGNKSSHDSSTPSKKNKNRKRSKRVIRTNAKHSSREVVDSDTDSESEDAAKPSSKQTTPNRRKTADSNRPAPTSLKRLKPLESDEETSAKKRLKRRKDDDNSLMCEETIPRSPQPHGTCESQDVPAVEERSGSRLEMPFATVPQSVAQPRIPAGAARVAVDVSLPATPDSSNSGEVPLTIDSSRTKEDGSKSPAESSEVDMESLSGQGKAGSEDSRLDIEFSSSSDTRRASRGRRRQTAVKKELEEEVVKSPEQFKRKRKAKPETPGRGKGRGRGRHGSGVGRGVGRNPDDEDVMDTNTRDEVGRLDRLDNAALAALAHPKPNSTSKYNGRFYVQLGKPSSFGLGNTYKPKSVFILNIVHIGAGGGG